MVKFNEPGASGPDAADKFCRLLNQSRNQYFTGAGNENNRVFSLLHTGSIPAD
jgi:hypothetical protein